MRQKTFKNKRIGVLMGGRSSEREVSLKSGTAVCAALARLGYEHVPIDVDQNIAAMLKQERIEVAFIALHGRYGEDGAIQGLLEIMQIPYTGSKITASAIAMDKSKSHDIFIAHQLPTPETRVLTKTQAAFSAQNPLPLELPIVVKPLSEGSSVGVSIVKTEEHLSKALENAFQHGNKVIIQRYIAGKEIHVGILNQIAIGAIEIRPKRNFYDYEAKYVPGMSEHIYPAPLPPDVYKTVLRLAEKVHQAMGCDSYSRVDFLVDEAMDPVVLEVNTLPGMTETSLMPEIAQGSGIDFDTLVEKILETAATAYGV